MTERRCGGCRHWGDEGEVGQFRTCMGVAHDDRYLVGDPHVPDDLAPGVVDCWYDEDDIAERRRYRESHPAVTQDMSGLHAAIRCRSDFGCVLWEAKHD